MPKLTLSYIGDGSDKEYSNSWISLSLANIECEDLLEGLAILHERLNAVAMPRIHQEQVKSTVGAISEDLVAGLQSNDEFVTISC